MGATVRGINIRDLKRIEILVPPFAEQTRIAYHLARATSGVVSADQRAHREIELLREYRTRLIADVVTGKLDVREAAARLPIESGDSDSMDETEASADGEADGDEGEIDSDAESAAALDE